MGAQGGQTDPDRIHKGTEGKQYGPSGDQKATIANQTGTQIDHMRPKGRQPEPQRIHNGDQGKQKGPSGNPRATIAFFEHLFKQRSEDSILKMRIMHNYKNHSSKFVESKFQKNRF